MSRMRQVNALQSTQLSHLLGDFHFGGIPPPPQRLSPLTRNRGNNVKYSGPLQKLIICSMLIAYSRDSIQSIVVSLLTI